MPSLDRQPSDTARSLAALHDYAAMGAGRSLRDLAARYRRQSVDGASTVKPPTTRLETLGTWSAAGSWVARCEAYDADQRAIEDADRAAIRRIRRAELEDADYAQGAAIRAWAAELLELAPKFTRRSVSRVERDGVITEVITLALAAGPGELARAAKLASDLQRMSVGIETERTATTIEIRYVDDDPNDPTDLEAPA